MTLNSFSFSDRVTTVKTDIYVTSFGPVSDTDMVSSWFLIFKMPQIIFPNRVILQK